MFNANFGAPKANYDESKVPQIKLPNILSIPGGSFTAESALDWNQNIRPALADIFENKIYGEIPPRPAKEVFEVVEASGDALGGKAIRRQIKIPNRFIDMTKYGCFGAIYTQTTDVEIEVNGLFTYDRKVLKVDEEKVREVNQKLSNIFN